MLAATGLMACSSDDKNDLKEEPRPMIVDVLGTSRAPEPTTTATLSSFKMNYENNTYNFKKDGTWSTNSWPSVVSADQKIDFYAYTNGTFAYNNGNPYVAFSVEETATNQHDLLVAVHKGISYNDAGGHVSLLFNHACAAVRFSVQITNLLHTQLNGNLSVNSIILRNVSSQGDYYFSGSWSNVGNPRYYTLTDAAITVTTAPQQLYSNYLYMIPQTRDADGCNGTYLEINYTKDTEVKQATIPLAIDWKAGESYPINIKLGTTIIP